MAERANRDRWRNADELLMISELITDIKAVAGRYMTVCLRAAECVPAEAEEWQAAAQAAGAAAKEMAERCERLFNRYAAGHGHLPGD